MTTRWQRPSLLVVVIAVGLAVVSGSVAAAPAASPTTLISGQTYTLQVQTHGESVQSVKVVGAATLHKQTIKNGALQVSVKASSVNEKRSATLIVMFGGGSQQRDQLQVYPKAAGSQPGSGRVTKKQLQDAKKYKKIKSNWVETRVRYVRAPNGKAKQIEYQQLDPTKGKINPKTGVPEGKWVTVSVNKQGNPEWLFQSPRGAMSYAAQQSATKRGYRSWLLEIAIAIVFAGWLIPFGLLVLWRRMQDTMHRYQVGAFTALKWTLREAF